MTLEFDHDFTAAHRKEASAVVKSVEGATNVVIVEKKTEILPSISSARGPKWVRIKAFLRIADCSPQDSRGPGLPR